MAIMYPEVFPGCWDPAVPEFTVYQILRKLSNSYHVFYSERITGGLFGKPECEIDFIIFNGRDVIICLEVKGGVISFDGGTRQWIQNGSAIADVIKQAADAMHTLHRALSFETTNTCVDWALCFPDCCLSNHGGALGVQPAQIIDEKALTNIEAAILKLEYHIRSKYPHRAGMSPAEAKAFIGRLTRSIGFVQILGVRFAREAEQIVQVTNEQLDVLTDLETNPRMLVQGAAGTGKTIIAQTFARRIADGQKEILLLFFNRGIASKVRDAFPRETKVSVSTFSSFAKRLVEQHDPDWWAAEKESTNEFWNITLPLKLMDIPVAELPKYDAVIVDEGQDFKPEWFEFLNTVLRHPENSFFTVLLDEKQDIFGHWKSFPCLPKPFHKVLTKNCRNTKQIVGYVNKAYPTNMISFERSPPGAPVCERVVMNETDELKRITEDVKTLTVKERIKPGSIVILIGNAKEESCLRGVTDIAGFKVQSTFSGYEPNARHLYYSTIDIFKGLEADVVLLCLGDMASADVPCALYVRGSRAKHLLHIYRRAKLNSRQSP
jgi:hypothetical protein